MSTSELPYEQFDKESSHTSKTKVSTPTSSHVSRKCRKILFQWTLVAIVGLVVLVIIILAATSDFITSKKSSPKYENQQSVLEFDKIRLPSNVLPVKYRIMLHPNTSSKSFSGDTKILVKVNASTDTILLNSVHLHILKVNVYRYHGGDMLDFEHDAQLPLENITEDQENERISIHLKKKLYQGDYCVVHVAYDALFAKSYGLYMNSYNTKSGGQRHMVVTHLQPTGARYVFPCYDEPGIKAKFQVVVVRENNQKALSNMPLHRSMVQGDLVMDHFEESAPMSTYLFCIAIFTDYEYLGSTSTSGADVRVWAPREQVTQLRYGLHVAIESLNFYESYFNVSFPLPKLDVFAVPEFLLSGMENFGLIFLNPRCLLTEEEFDDIIAAVLAHEIAHQWFGNLVTMEWWDDLWLNEAFATFIEYIAVEAFDPQLGAADIVTARYVRQGLTADEHLATHPVSSAVRDPKESSEKFDSVTYRKGASLLRMLSDVIGSNNFREGLIKYMAKYKFKNTQGHQMWAAMREAGSSSMEMVTSAEDDGPSVGELMDGWTKQKGFPVVVVRRHHGNKKIAVATQHRFIIDADRDGNGRVLGCKEEGKYDYCKGSWDIPLTYHFGNRNKKEHKWFIRNATSVIIPWHKNSKWLKMNVDQVGFYRVHYDQENWAALAEQLKRNRSAFSPMDRASLVQDAFALARAGYMPITNALDLTIYLMEEKEYAPFHIALTSISYVGHRLRNRPDYEHYRKYIVHLIRPRLEELGFENKGENLERKLRTYLIKTAANHNETKTVDTLKAMFDKWISNGTRFPSDLQYSVFQTAVVYGMPNEWNFLLEKLKVEADEKTARNLVQALALTTNEEILRKYLNLSLNPEIVGSKNFKFFIQSLVRTQIGNRLGVKFLMENWTMILKRYALVPFYMSNLIEWGFGQITDEKVYAETKEFLSTHHLGSGRSAAQRVMNSVRYNMNWLKMNERDIVTWLKNNAT